MKHHDKVVRTKLPREQRGAKRKHKSTCKSRAKRKHKSACKSRAKKPRVHIVSTNVSTKENDVRYMEKECNEKIAELENWDLPKSVEECRDTWHELTEQKN